MEMDWATLPRAARIGVIVGLTVAVLFAPFLVYAGVAFMNASVEWIQPRSGEGIPTLAGAVVFLLYLSLVCGIPSLLGGLIGALIGSGSRRS